MEHEQVRELVGSLARAQDAVVAERWMYQVEELAVPVNGSLRPVAETAAAALVQELPTATAAARPELLAVLVQLAHGAAEAEGSASVAKLRNEIERGLQVFEEIARGGTREERLVCVDLFSACARLSRESFDRSMPVLSLLAESGPDEHQAVAVERDDLVACGYPDRFEASESGAATGQ
ncbi:hypothetical protein [Streptomyces sp. NPDC091371]|uniref:hypothetical protein n=1 Tax=Streptomyces sp. NPDC091371 TaxID=3155303 RepID=UPI00343B5B57